MTRRYERQNRRRDAEAIALDQSLKKIVLAFSFFSLATALFYIALA